MTLAPNASTWPLQLHDTHPRHPPHANNLAPVHLERIDFEDVSFFFDFHHAAKLARVDSHPARHDSGNEDDEVVYLATNTPKAKGKQKQGAAPSLKRSPSPGYLTAEGFRSAKAIKTEASTDAATSSTASTPKTTLIDTYCIFRVQARTSQDQRCVANIQHALEAGNGLDGLDLGACSFTTEELSQAEQSTFGHRLTLHSKDSGVLLATLPLIDTDSFEPELRPDRFTNASWIAAADRLAQADELEVDASLCLIDPPPDAPTNPGEAAAVFVKLSIRVTVPLGHHAPSVGLRLAVIDDFAELARFANHNGTQRDEEQRRKTVTARVVMDNLRAAEFETNDHIQPTDLQPTLLPFQRRSTAFLLGREGKLMDADGTVHDTGDVMARNGKAEVGLWWTKLDDGLFYHCLEARFVDSPQLTLDSNLKGAMLAEEMGLGKTVEVIALILLNPKPDLPADLPAASSFFDKDNDIEVHHTKTTLIIAPETLRQQWLDEIARHAPELQVYSYTSRQHAESDVPKGQTWVRWASHLDVIVTTYSVLSSELATAKREPPRSRRQPRKYERPRSPLIRLHFHRVVMDEVQMVGNSQAAETAAMIYRGSSLAVSGTPIKKIDDIKSCFRFLGMPCCRNLFSPKAWNAILSPKLAPALISVLQTIGARHSKAEVAHEMSLPMQTRTVIPIDFTAIEAAFYADVWKDALAAVEIDEEGNPLRRDWELDFTVLSRHLHLLRQACTHPQVAVHGRGAQVVGNTNLRSIDEVLELMIDSTKAELQSAKGQSFDKRTTKAILTLYFRDEARHRVAEAQMLDLAKELEAEVAQLEDDLRDAHAKGPLYKFSEEELELEKNEEHRRATQARSSDDEDAFDHLEPDVASKDSSEEWQRLYASPIHQEKRRQRGSNLSRISLVLRLNSIRLHRLLQFTGNLYFQMGEFMDDREREQKALLGEPAAVKPREDDTAEPGAAAKLKTEGSVDGDGVKDEEDEVDELADESGQASKPKANGAAVLKVHDAKDLTPREQLKQKEDEAYLRAEQLRQKLLTEHRQRVEHAIGRLTRNKVDFGINAMLCRNSDFLEAGGGITTHDAYEGLSETCHLLDRHAEVLFNWRQSIIERLRRPVNRDINLERDDDDQYQENLDTQAEAEALLEMYRPLIAERENILGGTVAVGATAKPQLYAELEAALRNARRNRLLSGGGRSGGDDDEDRDDEDNDVIRVQKQQLEHFKRLDKERKAVSLRHASHSLPALRNQLKDVMDNGASSMELELARRAINECRKLMSEQTKLLSKIKVEAQTLLAPLFNERSNYFKEMQVLSDSVSDPSFNDLEAAITAVTMEEGELRTKAERLSSRLRYLSHLGAQQQRGSGGEGVATSSDGGGGGGEEDKEAAEEARRCYICTDVISIGVMTHACGHISCERCMKAWTSQGHLSCPMCKTPVKPGEVHRILYTPQPTGGGRGGGSGGESQAKAPLTTTHDGATNSAEANADGTHPPPPPPSTPTYRLITPSYRDLIDQTAVQARYGSKIDLVTKHIHHLFHTCGGQKSIIFSSFTRGLDVISQSLRANGLRYLRVTGGGKTASNAATQFRTQKDVAALLLHSEAQSAGLNLLEARHVHILEPFLERGLERQAVGRVHRIGQRRRTYVWVYRVGETVEERVLDAASRRGESLYLLSSPSSSSTSCSTSSSSRSLTAPTTTNGEGGGGGGTTLKFSSRTGQGRKGRGGGSVAAADLRGDTARSREEVVEVFCEALARRLRGGGGGVGGGGGGGGADGVGGIRDGNGNVETETGQSVTTTQGGTTTTSADGQAAQLQLQRERERQLRLAAISRRRLDEG